jgi:HK97 family phage portal protein
VSVFFKESRSANPIPYPAIPPNSQQGSMSIRSVNLSQADSALQKVAVFASVNLLASIASMLPVDVYRGTGNDRATIPMPRELSDLGGTGHGLPDFLWQVIYCWGLRGNTVGLIVTRDRFGNPTTIDLQHPDDVGVSQDDKGRLAWTIRGRRVDSDDVWHKRVYPTPGRVLGLSPIALHAVTVGQGIAAQNFGMQWFLDGAHPSSILTNDDAKMVDQEQARTVKDRFMAAIRGTREPVVLGGGWKYQQVQIAAGESQFLETQKYTAAECARIYGPGMPELLGYETGGSMTYANIEQRSIDLLKYTIDPWLVRLERVLTELLPAPQYVKFNRNALLRTDTLTRFQAYQIALRNGWQVIDDVRDLEDQPPVPWGAEPYLPAMGPSAAAAAETTPGGSS